MSTSNKSSKTRGKGAAGAATDDLARDEILYLPVDAIEPDPDQPRLDVDDELAASIAQHGVLQAIEVRPHPSGADHRWMITDGERRWRGARKAHQATIPSTLRLDVEDPADRLVRQLVRNEGKPLTSTEEALAFKRIIDTRRAAGDKKFGAVHLATLLGLPKSTVSDRLMATEIPAFWLDLVAKGPLQPSHVPLLHRWRKVPEKFQRRALEQMQADYRWPGGDTYSKAKKGERIYVEVFGTLLDTFMTKFIKPVRDVPGYTGPTDVFQGREYNAGRLVHATDPAQWQPIYRKASAAKRSKAKAASTSSGGTKADRAYEAQQQRYAEQRQRAEEARVQWHHAKPRILAATAEAINRASGSPSGALGQILISSTRGYGAAGKVEKLVAVGTTPEQLIRHCVMCLMAHAISNDYSAPQSFPPFAKTLGVDLKALLGGKDDENDDAPAPTKAKRARTSKKSKTSKASAAETVVDLPTAADVADEDASAAADVAGQIETTDSLEPAEA